MSPEYKIKYAILTDVFAGNDQEISSTLTEEEIEDLWDENYDEVQDCKYEFREGQVETDIPCEFSRHYESSSVAAQCPDGTWVGWTYWYGGGKHGEPEAIDWIEHAYNLECVEEEKLLVVRTFSKKDN